MKGNYFPAATAALHPRAHAGSSLRTRKGGRSITLVCTALFPIAFLVQNAAAVPINYIYEGIGTGTVGAERFTNARFTITALANTNNITPWDSASGGPQNTHLSAKVDIVGVGGFSITTPSHSWMSGSDFGSGGLGENLSSNWITLFEPMLLGYGLDTDFGPLLEPDPQHVGQFHGVATTAGELTFSSIDSVTFTAVIVPEPIGLVLAAFGCFAGLIHRNTGRPQGHLRSAL